jgi:hypothetical protein
MKRNGNNNDTVQAQRHAVNHNDATTRTNDAQRRATRTVNR